MSGAGRTGQLLAIKHVLLLESIYWTSGEVKVKSWITPWSPGGSHDPPVQVFVVFMVRGSYVPLLIFSLLYNQWVLASERRKDP